MKWNLDLQRELFQGTLASVGYIGSRGVNLWTDSHYNVCFPYFSPEGRRFFQESCERRSPHFSVIRARKTPSSSFYHAMVAKVKRRFSNNYALQVSFTFSKSIDDESGYRIGSEPVNQTIDMPIPKGFAKALSDLVGKMPQPDYSLGSFKIDVSGFLGTYGPTTPQEEAINALKAFCGLSIALRILKIEPRYRAELPKAQFSAHRSEQGEWKTHRYIELDPLVSHTFNELVINDLDGKLNSDQKKVAWIERQLESVRCVLSNEEKSKQIILSSQWLFDSYCGRNDLLSFVQMMVVMEILLGDKHSSDLVGLGELLRNRCAYLLGKSNAQRRSLLKDFKAIYDLRSNIVHRGKSKLNMDEWELFEKLTWMCRRVIQEEVKLFRKDLEG